MRSDLKNVTSAQARKTSLMVAAVLAVIAGIFLYRGRMTEVEIAGTIATVLLIIGVFVPPAAKLFHRGWMTLAFALGYVNSRIILTVIYFLIFVPYGVASRLIGRDPLQLREKGRASYWTPRTATRQSKEQFERLF